MERRYNCSRDKTTINYFSIDFLHTLNKSLIGRYIAFTCNAASIVKQTFPPTSIFKAHSANSLSFACLERTFVIAFRPAHAAFQIYHRIAITCVLLSPYEFSFP